MMVLCEARSIAELITGCGSLAATEQTIADQVLTPPARPTMWWVFHCVEGSGLLHVQTATTSLTMVFRLEPVHRLIASAPGTVL